MSQYLDRVRLANRRLSKPPKSAFSRRVVRRGQLVIPFALDLRFAQSQNAYRRATTKQRYGRRKLLLEQMSWQILRWMMRDEWLSLPLHLRQYPLSGRPQVNAVRFSTRMTDGYANFAKEAIDCLQPSRGIDWGHGLRIISGDAPHQIEENQWCELVSRGDEGFVYLEVRSDA
jgi:hypothetical protein